MKSALTLRCRPFYRRQPGGGFAGNLPAPAGSRRYKGISIDGPPLALAMIRTRGSHGWREIGAADKRAIIENIVSGRAPAGPLHPELDICDRCNVACYFRNAIDVPTKAQVPLE